MARSRKAGPNRSTSIPTGAKTSDRRPERMKGGMPRSLPPLDGIDFIAELSLSDSAGRRLASRRRVGLEEEVTWLNLTRGDIYPVLPLRDIVVFPHMIVPLFVGREKSVRALEDVMKRRQADPSGDAKERRPGRSDGRTTSIDVGTVSTVLQLLKLPDGTVKVLVEGGSRAPHHRASPTMPDLLPGLSPRRMPEDARRDPGAGGAGRARWSPSSSSISSSTRRSRPRCWSRSTRSRIPASWPTRSPRICSSRSPTSRNC